MSIKRTLILDFDDPSANHAIPYLSSILASLLIETGRLVTLVTRQKNWDLCADERVVFVDHNWKEITTILPLLDSHHELVLLAYESKKKENLAKYSDLLFNFEVYLNLYREISLRRIRLLLVSSGSAVYGEANEIPIAETHLTKPCTDFGASKLTLESFAHVFARNENLEFVCVRPSNVYGPGQRPFSGQGYVANAIATALRSNFIEIQGSIGVIRDYIYVDDYASGIVQALNFGEAANTYNVGCGIGSSNLEIADVIKSLLELRDHNVDIRFVEENTRDIKVNVLDSVKLQRLGWGIPRTCLTDGLTKTIEWQMKLQDQIA